MPVQWAVHDKSDGNPHMHLLAPLRTIDPEDGSWQPKGVNAYLVRNQAGEELEATAAEIKALGSGWQKVFRYTGGRQLTQAEAAAAGLHPTKDRKSKAPVQTTKYLSEWSGNWGGTSGSRERSPVKLLELRERWERTCNLALADAGSDAHVDSRSLRDQGVEALPQVHLGPEVAAIERHARTRSEESGVEYEPVTDRARENERRKKVNELLKELVQIMKQIISSRLERAKSLEAKRAAQRAAARRRPKAKKPYAPQRGRRVSPRGGYGR